MQLPGTEGVKRGVEARLGVGMVSCYSVESECQQGVLRRVPIEGWRITRTMNLVYRNQKYFSPVAERFREFAKSYGERELASSAASAEGGKSTGQGSPAAGRRSGGRTGGGRGDRG
jgi:DNA-binding transcriptional LysR family regulator